MLKIEDLKEGEYYKFNYSNYYGIGKCKRSKSKDCSHMVYSNNNYYKNNTPCVDNIQIITLEEKHWLDECIKADKFIPYEEAMETFRQESNENFAILLNNQEELNVCIKWAKNNGYKEIGNSSLFSKNYPYIRFKVSDKEYQTCFLNNIEGFPLKTLSELGITIENESLVGRWCKFIGKTEWYGVKKGDYDQIIEENRQLYILKNYRTIEKLDLLKEFELMPEKWTPEQENKPQFEVGKWYKFNDKWYAKMYSQSQCSESIDCDGKYEKNIAGIDLSGKNKNNHLLTNLSEIQPYLPDNHPDKITKQENYEYKVVHCKTQEELKFAISKGLFNINWEHNLENTCLELNGKSHSRIQFYQGKNSKIYSFEEWCNKFGHKPDFLNKQENNNSIPNNNIIEVGDEVEITNSSDIYKIGVKGILLQIDKGDDIPYKIKTETRYKETWCRNVKLIKKASQTTNYIHEKKVAEQPKNVPQTTTLLRFEPEDELLIDTSVRQIKSIKQELIELN